MISVKEEMEILNIFMDCAYNSIQISGTTIENVTKRLIKANEDYCNCVNQLKTFLKLDQEIGIKHYIATTVGGMKNDIGSVGGCYEVISRSSYNSNFINILESVLGDVLGKPTACKNAIGKCAEVRVTDNLLNRNVKIDDYKKIEFTRATRPRTQEEYFNTQGTTKSNTNYYIGKCENCIAVFGK